MSVTNIDTNFCKYCGKPFPKYPNPFTVSDPYYYCNCKPIIEENKSDIGWICPVCGCGVNPSEKKCPCNNKSVTFT